MAEDSISETTNTLSTCGDQCYHASRCGVCEDPVSVTRHFSFHGLLVILQNVSTSVFFICMLVTSTSIGEYVYMYVVT